MEIIVFRAFFSLCWALLCPPLSCPAPLSSSPFASFPWPPHFLSSFFFLGRGLLHGMCILWMITDTLPRLRHHAISSPHQVFVSIKQFAQKKDPSTITSSQPTMLKNDKDVVVLLFHRAEPDHGSCLT